jgi:peptidoglycan hydrolase CwlO-like protein
MVARFIYNVWLDMVVSINQLKAKDGELSFKIRQLTIEVNSLKNENSSLKYEVTELKDEISTLNFKLNELKHDNSELATELEYISENIDSKRGLNRRFSLFLGVAIKVPYVLVLHIRHLACQSLISDYSR